MQQDSEKCRRTPTPSRPISCGMSSCRTLLVSRWTTRRKTCQLFWVIGIVRAVPINRKTVRLIFASSTSLNHVMARCDTHRSSKASASFLLPSRFLALTGFISQNVIVSISARIMTCTERLQGHPWRDNGGTTPSSSNLNDITPFLCARAAYTSLACFAL